jgi:acyl homoserine lactone synthase
MAIAQTDRPDMDTPHMDGPQPDMDTPHMDTLFSARALLPDEPLALDAAFRLRHAVFAHELGWVPGARCGRERDRCDDLATHFAVYTPPGPPPATSPRLVGYARVLLPEHGLMLQREFSALLTGQPRPWDPRVAFEVSRFVVRSGQRGRLGPDGRGAVEHLARAIATWAIAHGRTEWLSVCEVRHVRALRLRGLPFARFGRVVEYQSGVPVCAARLDLPRAAARLRVRRPADYAWYMERMRPLC